MLVTPGKPPSVIESAVATHIAMRIWLNDCPGISLRRIRRSRSAAAVAAMCCRRCDCRECCAESHHGADHQVAKPFHCHLPCFSTSPECAASGVCSLDGLFSGYSAATAGRLAGFNAAIASGTAAFQIGDGSRDPNPCREALHIALIKKGTSTPGSDEHGAKVDAFQKDIRGTPISSSVTYPYSIRRPDTICRCMAACAPLRGNCRRETPLKIWRASGERRGVIGVLSRRLWTCPVDSLQEMYFRQAEHSLKMAAFCKTHELQVAWLELAERWLKMMREPSNVSQERSEPATPMLSP